MDTQLKPASDTKKTDTKSAADDPLTPEEFAMGFLEHLGELRDRLIKAALGLAATTILSMVFANYILLYLMTPIGQDDFQLQTLGPTEGVVIYFRVALLSGAIIAIPWITWQLWKQET